MNDERVGDGLFNAPHVEEVFGRGLSPSLYALLATHLLHENAQEVSTVLALRHDPGLNLPGFEAGTLIKTRTIPGIEHSALVPRPAERAETRLKESEDL